MPITKSRNVQYPVVATVEIAFGDIATGDNQAVASLPDGATVTGGLVIVDTAFDATATTINIGDAASATRYGSAVNLQALGDTALTVTGFKTAGSTDVLVAVTQTGTATAGAARILIEYVVEDRGHEVQT